jgi:hypothetical protein
MRCVIFVLLACVACLPVQAKIYKWVMPDGSIQYSDRPQEEGAKELDLPPLQTFTPPPTPALDRDDEDQKTAAAGYDSVRVVAPKPDESLRDNAGTVTVRVELEPPLQPGHKVEILLDGTAIGSGAGSSATLTNVDRGSHTVSAVVKDAEGRSVASAPGVTFHLKRAARAPLRVQPRQ